MKRRLTLALAAALILAACNSASSDTTQTSSPDSTTTTTTSTPTTTSTSQVPDTTTTTTSEPVMLTLIVHNPPIMWSATGEITVEGRVDPYAIVTVDGVEAETYNESAGVWSFSVEVELPEGGDHLIEIEAVADGASAKDAIRVVVDHSFDVEFGFITALDPDANVVTVDFAEWFFGEEAEKAAVKDGVANEDGTIDGGYYIRNVNPRLREFPVALPLETPFVVQVCYPDAGPCLARDWLNSFEYAAALEDPDSTLADHGWSWYGGGYLPVWLVIDDGVILQIDEQYLP